MNESDGLNTTALGTARGLLAALAFSAEKHRDQRRKGAEGSPYINHPIQVADLLARCGVSDLETLQAAVLHDTVEDTETTPEELTARFGKTVCDLVLETTDDKTLEKEVRKRRQIEHAPSLSQRAKVIKIADKITNVRDVVDNPADGWDLDRRRKYIRWACDVWEGLKGQNDELDRLFCEAVARGDALLQSQEVSGAPA